MEARLAPCQPPRTGRAAGVGGAAPAAFMGGWPLLSSSTPGGRAVAMGGALDTAGGVSALGDGRAASAALAGLAERARGGRPAAGADSVRSTAVCRALHAAAIGQRGLSRDPYDGTPSANGWHGAHGGGFNAHRAGQWPTLWIA